MPRRVRLRATTATRGKLAFPTRESWVRHVAISGGIVTRIPRGGANAGQLAARYGGASTRYPSMRPRFDLAPAHIRALDALAQRSDTIDRAVDAPREFLMHDYEPALNRLAGRVVSGAAQAVKDAGLPGWVLPVAGAAVVAYALNAVAAFLPRRT